MSLAIKPLKMPQTMSHIILDAVELGNCVFMDFFLYVSSLEVSQKNCS